MEQETNKYNIIGCITLLLAILNNDFGYLGYIYTPNTVELIQGLLYGICIGVNIISLYNRSHNISICKKKKKLNYKGVEF